MLIQGPRQSGKSTLARALVEQGVLDHCVTLDDVEPLEWATRSPDGFVDSLRGRVVLDEIQAQLEGLLELPRAMKSTWCSRARPGALSASRSKPAHEARATIYAG